MTTENAKKTVNQTNVLSVAPLYGCPTMSMYQTGTSVTRALAVIWGTQLA
jgi:hypothetical protein